MTPESDIIAKTAVNIITELFKVSLKGMAAFSNWLKEANTTHDVLGISAEKYVKKLEDRYSEVRIIGMTKPVKLRNIYVKVNILDSKSSVQSLSVKQLEEIFYKEGKIKSFIEKDDDNENNERINQIKYIRETLPGLDIVNSHDRVFLIGKPGSGKTTFLKYLTLASLDNKLSKKKIPIYISLKDYADSGKNIIDFIVDQFDICDFPNAFLFVENIIKNGNCLILFDGLDEAIEQDERIITSLNQFIDKYLKNKFVISCRIAASNYVFEKFLNYKGAAEKK